MTINVETDHPHGVVHVTLFTCQRWPDGQSYLILPVQPDGALSTCRDDASKRSATSLAPSNVDRATPRSQGLLSCRPAGNATSPIASMESPPMGTSPHRQRRECREAHLTVRRGGIQRGRRLQSGADPQELGAGSIRGHRRRLRHVGGDHLEPPSLRCAHVLA